MDSECNSPISTDSCQATNWRHLQENVRDENTPSFQRYNSAPSFQKKLLFSHYQDTPDSKIGEFSRILPGYDRNENHGPKPKYRRLDMSFENCDKPPSHNGLYFDESNEEFDIKMVMSPEPKQCLSSGKEIKSAMQRLDDEPNLIGDFSKTHVLPTVRGKHSDLKSISCDVLNAVLRGEFSSDVETCTVVDCRYPYEYAGGHIAGAKNVYTKEAILEDFLKSHQEAENTKKRHIIVFHCEFSSERGPLLMRFLREKDREANADAYPSLNYPEIYLLHGGYKALFEQHPDVCYPQAYIPMLHKEHASDLRHFRVKSKSWPGVRKRALACLRF